MKIFVQNLRQLRHNDDGDAGEKTFSTFVYLRSCVLWSAYNPNINMCWVCVYVLMEERRLLIFKHCTQTVANYMFENICRHTTPLKHLLTHAHSPMHTLSHSHTHTRKHSWQFLFYISKKGFHKLNAIDRRCVIPIIIQCRKLASIQFKWVNMAPTGVSLKSLNKERNAYKPDTIIEYLL